MKTKPELSAKLAEVAERWLREREAGLTGYQYTEAQNWFYAMAWVLDFRRSDNEDLESWMKRATGKESDGTSRQRGIMEESCLL